MRGLVGIVVPVFLLCFVSIFSPFAILNRNTPPPDLIPPGWYSSVAIFLWGENRAQPTLAIASLFVVMTLICIGILIAVSMRKMLANYGVVSEIVLFLVWISVCQVTYGNLQGWTLVQVPVLPFLGITFLLTIYGYQRSY